MTYVYIWPKKFDLRDVKSLNAELCSFKQMTRRRSCVGIDNGRLLLVCSDVQVEARAPWVLKILSLSLEQKEGADIFPNACIDWPRHVRIMSSSAFASCSAFPTMRQWVFSRTYGCRSYPCPSSSLGLILEIVPANVQGCPGNFKTPTYVQNCSNSHFSCMCPKMSTLTGTSPLFIPLSITLLGWRFQYICEWIANAIPRMPLRAQQDPITIASVALHFSIS